MSTKIYDGIRFKRRYLRQFQEAAYQHGLDDLVKRVRILLENIKPEFIEETRKKYDYALSATKQDHEEASLRSCLLEEIRELFHTNHTKLNPLNPFNFLCGWNIYALSNYYYAIPWGDNSQGRAEKARALPFVEEYGYWNNTDRPDSLTATQWDRRRRNWDAAYPNDFH